ncbi:MAG: MFS transporter [Oscillospiraceae bacterium]|nr:MFS transporter [Oscillospiraceae bacterium]MBR5260888.1 MFS transporter [Oscillospiraceae bacterium]
MASLLLAIIYLSFISLGLPDAMLGSAWPTMYPEMNVPVSYAGILSFIIASGTIISSLMADRLIRRFGTGRINAVSVLITAISLFAFSVSRSYWILLIIALPYGLGAGAIDASLNNYVALNYSSRHMSWLHCMWGVGATVGPYIMGTVLTLGSSWRMGYVTVGIIQTILAVFLFLSLALWKKSPGEAASEEQHSAKPLKLIEIVRIPGAKEVLVAFFCYCAIEQTVGLWASSYLVLHCGIASETAASFASMFFIGITVGRALSGFLTAKFSDNQLIALGTSLIAFGCIVLLLPLGEIVRLAALIVIGLGCAPIYPCIIHSTPVNFGAQNSQAIIGVQMASAYVGICLMPPLFGLIANHISIALLSPFLLILTALMGFMYLRVVKNAKQPQV